MDLEELPEIPHDFSEHRQSLVYDSRTEEDVGSGSVACTRCGLVLPTLNGQIMPSWRTYVDGIDCSERLVDFIHES